MDGKWRWNVERAGGDGAGYELTAGSLLYPSRSQMVRGAAWNLVEDEPAEMEMKLDCRACGGGYGNEMEPSAVEMESPRMLVCRLKMEV